TVCSSPDGERETKAFHRGHRKWSGGLVCRAYLGAVRLLSDPSGERRLRRRAPEKGGPFLGAWDPGYREQRPVWGGRRRNLLRLEAEHCGEGRFGAERLCAPKLCQGRRPGGNPV